MSFQIVFLQITSLFLLIGVGYFLRKTEHLDQNETSGIAKILIDVILPAVLISSFQSNVNPKILGEMRNLFFYWILFYVTLILLSSLISRFFTLPKERKRILQFFLIFGNVGYMGLPVLDVIFPENGLLFGSIGIVSFHMFLWTYGINLFVSEGEKRSFNLRNFFNNGVIAIIFGMTLMFLNIKLPGPILTSLNMLARATFPLAMIVIGSGLAQVKISGIFKDLNILAYALIKLLVLPISALFILNFFNASDPIKTVFIIQIAMPASANGVIFAERMKSDYAYAAESLFLSTLMASITIPIVSYLASIFN